MNRVKHKTVLNFLEQRAVQFRVGRTFQAVQDRQLCDKALDETGTMETEALSWSDGESVGQSFEMLEELEVQEIVEELLKVYGVAPGKV